MSPCGFISEGLLSLSLFELYILTMVQEFYFFPFKTAQKYYNENSLFLRTNRRDGCMEICPRFVQEFQRICLSDKKGQGK